MSTHVYLICKACKKNFWYAKKEYNRQTKKKGRAHDSFSCSRSCDATWRNQNMSPEMRKRISIKIAEKNRGRRLPQSPFRKFIGGCKRRDPDLDFDIEYLEKIWKEQNGQCALSGIKLELTSGQKTPFSASVDRIDSNQGYKRGNIQFTSYSLNLAKQSFSNETIIELVEAIRSSLPSSASRPLQ